MNLSKKGSVAKLLENVRKGLADESYDNTSRQILLIGIARGMMFFHQHHIIHRDLKPDNILLDDNNYPLLIDFGLSKIPQFNFNSSSTKGCGTSIYMAPESISYNIYNEKTDVYSFGILMYQIVTDCKPYPILEKKKITEFEFKKKVVEENYRPVFDSKLKIKKSIKNLILKNVRILKIFLIILLLIVEVTILIFLMIQKLTVMMKNIFFTMLTKL